MLLRWIGMGRMIGYLAGDLSVHTDVKSFILFSLSGGRTGGIQMDKLMQ